MSLNSLTVLSVLFFLGLDNVVQFFLARSRCSGDRCLDTNSRDGVEQVLDHIEREWIERVTKGQCEHGAREQEEVRDQNSEFTCHQRHGEELAERIDSNEVKSSHDECSASRPGGHCQFAALGVKSENQLGRSIKH